jgi:hypothetical protein
VHVGIQVSLLFKEGGKVRRTQRTDTGIFFEINGFCAQIVKTHNDSEYKQSDTDEKMHVHLYVIAVLTRYMLSDGVLCFFKGISRIACCYILTNAVTMTTPPNHHGILTVSKDNRPRPIAFHQDKARFSDGVYGTGN